MVVHAKRIILVNYLLVLVLHSWLWIEGKPIWSIFSHFHRITLQIILACTVMPCGKGIIVSSNKVLATLFYIFFVHRFIKLDVYLVLSSLFNGLIEAIMHLFSIALVPITISQPQKPKCLFVMYTYIIDLWITQTIQIVIQMAQFLIQSITVEWKYRNAVVDVQGKAKCTVID